VTPKIVKPFAPGEGPDPEKLFGLREGERDKYSGINTMIPGIPDVGAVVDTLTGESMLSVGQPAAK